MVDNPITVNNFASLFWLHAGWSGLRLFDGSGLKTLSRLVPDALTLVGPTGPTVGFRLLQHFSYFLLSSPHRFSIYLFVRFLCSRRCCTDELGTLHAD